MNTNMTFPKCFSDAGRKLRMKFRAIDPATIEDSIQYAKIEYWRKGIETSIPNDSEAFGWFLNVAHRYLYKEAIRLNRHCNIFSVSGLSNGVDPEQQYIYRELL